MERKAIIELSKDKGMTEFVPVGSNALWEQIEKFVSFAIEAEREACAKLCENLFQAERPYEIYAEASKDCADAIRARGNI